MCINPIVFGFSSFFSFIFVIRKVSGWFAVTQIHCTYSVETIPMTNECRL